MAFMLFISAYCISHTFSGGGGGVKEILECSGSSKIANLFLFSVI